ncbi:hypothetical protein DPF_0311 [Desulfoplanes formicivorans]|uniref:Uncharacterized protein n=1 Tax=Desulfoplanes formicivorans TaxID=1592317 RepID=A0A194AEU5_9BACT|nr:hypothetical protein DPF_0311 [Desulfoplanes formicivorans]
MKQRGIIYLLCIIFLIQFCQRNSFSLLEYADGAKISSKGQAAHCIIQDVLRETEGKLADTRNGDPHTIGHASP